MISTSIRRAAAKKLRANTTPHERTLWRALKELPVEGTHFRRQAPIGPYVVDFFCPAKHLIIELDGGDITTTTKPPNATAKGSFGLNRRDIVLSASGIPRSPAI
jgi:very-short-patch-repair endonuclease